MNVPSVIDESCFESSEVRRYINPKNYLVNKIANYEKEFAEVPENLPNFREWLSYALTYWQYSYGVGVDRIADRYRRFILVHTGEGVGKSEWQADLNLFLGVPAIRQVATRQTRNEVMSLLSPQSYQAWREYEQQTKGE